MSQYEYRRVFVILNMRNINPHGTFIHVAPSKAS